MGYDIAATKKPIFYNRYVDKTYVRRKKNAKDQHLQNLNTYHDNIKLTIEVNPTMFLDTEIKGYNSTITTKDYDRSLV